jgi:hypothetical protein
MVTKQQKKEGFDNILIRMSVKKKLKYLKVENDILTYSDAIDFLINFREVRQ